jgi:nucleotidyltransferase substrate binding protein (TIGR01987 family)
MVIRALRKSACQQLVQTNQQFEGVLAKLQQILHKPIEEGRCAIDVTIKRFALAIDLFLKFLKRLLAARGKQVVYPRDVLEEAYAGGLIDDREMWLATKF